MSRIQKQQDRILDLELKRAINENHKAALTFICRMIKSAKDEIAKLEHQVNEFDEQMKFGRILTCNYPLM